MRTLAHDCGGELRNGNPDAMVRNVCTDSRNVKPGDLFVALTGDRFDAHAFLPEVAKNGAAAAIVERKRVEFAPPVEFSLPLIVVENTRVALRQIAAASRSELELPVIALCGANGKTTTKELVASVLRQRFRTVWSEASFNNDIGVPLTLSRIDRSHEAAVLEAGTNHPGELDPLVRMIQPRYGIITSIGPEHLEFFGDIAGVAEEEAALARVLPEDGKLFVNGDSPEIARIIESTRAPVVRLGLQPGNDWRAVDLRPDARGLTFTVEAPDPEYCGEYRLQLLGRHQAVNAMFAVALGRELRLGRAEIQRGLTDCQPPKMRMQIGSANGVTVLNDAYNANEDSMRGALETLRDFPASGRRIAVLGDMAELGVHAPEAHLSVGRCAAMAGVNTLFAVGALASGIADGARVGGLNDVHYFADIQSAIEALKHELKPGDTVLLKASRAMRFERIGEALRAA